MKRSAAIIAGLIMLAAPLCGCSPAREYSQMSGEYFYVMNTSAALTIYDYFEVNGVEDRLLTAKFSNMEDEVRLLLYGLDSSLSTSYEGSDISRFNAADAGARVEIGEDAYNILSVAKSMYELTEGYYNPAVYYSLQAYGFNGGEEPKSIDDLPSEEEISIYVELSEHFGELALEKEGDKYYATKPDITVEWQGAPLTLKVDLGGIGKGYAVDKVNYLFLKYGYEYGNFNFGASSIAFKKYPEDAGTFTLGLANPRRKIENGVYTEAEQYIETDVSDVCVSSSADNKNAYILTDESGAPVRYCHIFDPYTGKPIESGVMSATVIGGSAAENDALTTAIMAMGAGKAVEFINSALTGRQVVFTVDSGDGYKFYTNIPVGGYRIVSENFTRLEIN